MKVKSNREYAIGQWQERLCEIKNAVLDFSAALPTIHTDDEFMTAYAALSRIAGDILDSHYVPAGDIDGLRDVLTESN